MEKNKKEVRESKPSKNAEEKGQDERGWLIPFLSVNCEENGDEFRSNKESCSNEKRF